MISRRAILIGGGTLALAGCVSGRKSAVEDRIAGVEAGLGGRIGACLLDTRSGTTSGYRLHERFAMCSTFKAALAGAVLARADAGILSLSDRLKIDPADLVSFSPVTEHRREMTLEELCGAAVSSSDNTAANLLLGQVGGPEGMTQFFRKLGDTVSRLDRYETELNSNVPGDVRDTTTPAAMSLVLARLAVEKETLTPGAQGRLLGWMADEQNARNRIRAAVPPAWWAGNKPGTSNNGAVNDIAVLRPPGRDAIIISIYTNAPTAGIPAGIQAIADVAGILINELTA